MLSHQPEEVGEGDSRKLGGLAVPQPAASNLLQEPEDPHLVGNLARVPGSVLERILGDLDLNRPRRC